MISNNHSWLVWISAGLGSDLKCSSRLAPAATGDAFKRVILDIRQWIGDRRSGATDELRCG